MNPLVSVAIVTYNQRPFLQECLDSILAQDYRPLEIVVADDGSTDGTHEMLRAYEQAHPGVFVLCLSETNAGITENSNRAHFACTGKYVAWIGGDDVMLPGKISKQVAYMEAHDACTLCYHDADVFDSDSGRVMHRFSQKIKPFDGDLRDIVVKGNSNLSSTTMVRRDKTPAHGYDTRIKVVSDFLYWVECLDNGGTMNYLDDVLLRYRKHAANVTNNRDTWSDLNRLYWEDKFLTTALLLLRYPWAKRSLMYRFGLIWRGRRHLGQEPYFQTLRYSLGMKWNARAAGAAALYLLSAGRIKK